MNISVNSFISLLFIIILPIGMARIRAPLLPHTNADGKQLKSSFVAGANESRLPKDDTLYVNYITVCKSRL